MKINTTTMDPEEEHVSETSEDEEQRLEVCVCVCVWVSLMCPAQKCKSLHIDQCGLKLLDRARTLLILLHVSSQCYIRITHTTIIYRFPERA
jgi:hypothetical protein